VCSGNVDVRSGPAPAWPLVASEVGYASYSRRPPSPTGRAMRPSAAWSHVGQEQTVASGGSRVGYPC